MVSRMALALTRMVNLPCASVRTPRLPFCTRTETLAKAVWERESSTIPTIVLVWQMPVVQIIPARRNRMICFKLGIRFLDFITHGCKKGNILINS